jgi:steroid delta-isomerase-like uncharacterized protein
MSALTNKAIVRRLIEEVWNQKRVDLLDEFFDEGIVEHAAGMPPRTGLETIKQFTAMGLSAFPDLQLTIEDEIAEGDKVAIRWTNSATHQAELMGIPATGKRVTQSGATVYRLSNGRIVELWFYPDNLSVMQQLGVIPAPQGA